MLIVATFFWHAATVLMFAGALVLIMGGGRWQSIVAGSIAIAVALAVKWIIKQNFPNDFDRP